MRICLFSFKHCYVVYVLDRFRLDRDSARVVGQSIRETRRRVHVPTQGAHQWQRRCTFGLSITLNTLKSFCLPCAREGQIPGLL